MESDAEAGNHATGVTALATPTRPLPGFGLLRHIRRAFDLGLTYITGSIERYPSVAIPILAAVYVPAVLAASRAKLLSHDEIFTFYIADVQSLSAVFHKSQIDLNPPLSYLLTYLSFRVFLPSTLSCRLPEMVAFFAAMVFLYAFVKRRAGVLYGILAAAILFSGLAGRLAIDARPYALLLASVCLSLLAWQKARMTGAERLLGVCLLVIGGAGMLLSHIFGLLAWSALLGGEMIRTMQRRKLDWKLIIVWFLPLLSVATYSRLLSNQTAAAFPPAFQPMPRDIFTFYTSNIDRELVAILLTALAVLLILGRKTLRGYQTWFLTIPEWFSVAGIIASSGLLITYIMFSHHAFFARYGVIASVGIAIFFTIFLAWWSGRDSRAALLATAIVLLISGQITAAAQGFPLLLHPSRIAQATEPVIQPCQVCALTSSIDPRLPLVDASGLTFLEMNWRENESTLARIFYLTDPVASMQYAHATIFEGVRAEQKEFPIRANIASYSDFIQEHRHFFVFGDFDYPEDWLLRKLQADGANIRVRGRMYGQYKDHEVYEVTLQLNPAAPQ